MDKEVSEIKFRDMALRISKLEDDVKNFKRAFPRSSEGEVDYMGHREYHNTKIEAAKAEAQFWRQMRADLLRKGAWFLLLVALGLIVNGVLVELGLKE